MKSHYGKLMDDKAVASIVSLRELAETDEIDIPDVQRGLVWNPTQIANLWKSIFAGYPIGALTLYKQGEKWQLIDGQQRWHAIKLGLLEPSIETAMTTLWVNADNLELMVCTRRHPWGFRWVGDKLERLSHGDMVAKWNEIMQHKTSVNPFQLPTLQQATPYMKNSCKMIPLHLLLSRKAELSGEDASIWRQTEEWRNLVDAPSLPLIRFDLKQGDSREQNRIRFDLKQGDSGEQNRIQELFTRINKGGTPISSTDLTYSTLCSYMGREFKQKINETAAGFLPPNRVARLYARLAGDSLKEPASMAFWRKHKYEDSIRKAIDATRTLLLEEAKIPPSVYLPASADDWLSVMCWCMRKFDQLEGGETDKKLLCMLPYVVCRDPGYHTHFCERFYEALNAEELKVTNLLELIAIGVANAACYSAKTGMYPLNKPEKVELKAEYPYNEEWLHIFANPRNEALLHFLQAPYMNRLLCKECGFYPHEPATWGEAMNRPWDVDHIVPKSLWWRLEPEELLFQECLANKQMLYYRHNRSKSNAFIGVPQDEDAGKNPQDDFCYPKAGLDEVIPYAPRPGRLHSRRLQNNGKQYLDALPGYEEVVNRRLAEMVNRLWKELGIAQLVDTINKIPEMEHVPECLKLPVERWNILKNQKDKVWCALRHDSSKQQIISVKDFYHSLCSCLAVGVEENDAFRCFCWQQVDARTLKIEAGSRRLPDMTQAEWLKGAEKEGSRSAWWVEDGSFTDGTYVYGEKNTKLAALEAILKKVHPHG